MVSVVPWKNAFSNAQISIGQMTLYLQIYFKLSVVHNNWISFRDNHKYCNHIPNTIQIRTNYNLHNSGNDSKTQCLTVIQTDNGSHIDWLITFVNHNNEPILFKMIFTIHSSWLNQITMKYSLSAPQFRISLSFFAAWTHRMNTSYANVDSTNFHIFFI